MSTNLVSILAIVAAICLLALIGLQVGEIMHYSAEPSVWPVH